MGTSPLRTTLLAAAGLTAAFFLGFLADGLRAPKVPPAQAQAVPVGNGDVNADGAVDLSDAVGILIYLFLDGPPPVEISAPPCQDLTVLVVRHAEKVDSGSDPDLTPEGQVRAGHLRDALSMARIDAIIATQYQRTVQTVQPVADSHPPLQVQALAEANIVPTLRALPPGSVAVVAGNSFNIPSIIASLGVSGVTVPSDEYDNLWMIRFGASLAAGASMVHLKYWQP